MSEKNSYGEEISDLLNEIFNIWSDVEIDENGNELRGISSKSELERSKNILSLIDVNQIEDDDILKRYNELASIIKEWEKNYNEYSKTELGKINIKLDDIYESWTRLEKDSSGDSYNCPSNQQIFDISLKEIKELKKKKIDDEDTLDRIDEYEDILNWHKDDFKYDNEVNKKALQILDNVFNSWSSKSYEDGEEYRNPSSIDEIKSSRKELAKIPTSSQDIDPWVFERKNELLSVLDEKELGYPDNKSFFFVSLLFASIIIGGCWYWLHIQDYSIPDFEYNKEWFVTNVDCYIGNKQFFVDSISNDLNYGNLITKGTELVPLGLVGSDQIKVLTPDNEVGFISAKYLNGYKYATSRKSTYLSDDREAVKGELVDEGVELEILETHSFKERTLTSVNSLVRLPDGTTKWVVRSNLNHKIVENLPKINSGFKFFTTKKNLDKFINTQTFNEFESKYGHATSFLYDDGILTGYFRHLTIFEDGKRLTGLKLFVNEKASIDSMRFTEISKEKSYSTFPLFDIVLSFEPGRIMVYNYYQHPNLKLVWLKNLFDFDWVPEFVYIIIGIIFFLIVAFFFLSIPRIIASPVMCFFTYNSFFSNGWVKFFNFFIMLGFYYIFYLMTVMATDSWFWVGLFVFGVFFFWSYVNNSSIDYNRCPACRTMHSGIDEGTSFKGRVTNTSWGTYDIDKGTSIQGNTKVHTIERRSQKTVTKTDHFLDHRSCARCGYKWDVKRTEEKSTTTKY
ncbi:MAG: hypothetical protein JXR48_10585 [Candidatus Delongbacteria bacterium]|nr:hypothetical protein [Candidatus Delongbacteria bacterium]MBN2835398.1 hypothetical protein [Candidatus Delongbacteria bacterium]